ncbi:flagellin [Anaerospora hongkongensis]|uniref:Flagellin n=1 Tax=Anaerospora hongkongensis TaxID=244830 RepID=A0A4R1PNR3_9FIRM|nr:flagellin [Anaerospora hongkongensis]TCL33012.1 flagellin [Anaerospora hongkongensis]
MAMVINHNLSALNTYNQLNSNSTLMNKSLQKISSGYQINTAADDAAGLAISEKMRGQIRGLDQASANAQDSISMVQTAEGALSETTDILQRMRELAVQSASDTNTDADRANIQDEVDALVKEINRIADTTEFNTKKLLDGSMSGKTTEQASIDSNSAVKAAAGAALTDTTALLTDLTDADGNSLGIKAGDTVTVSYMKDGALVTGSLDVTATTTLADLEDISTFDKDGNATTGATKTVADDLGLTVDTTSGALTATAAATGTANSVYGLTITVTDSDGDSVTAATNALSDFTQTQAAKNTGSDKSSTILIGANTGQSITIAIDNMDAESLGVNNLQVDTQDAANVALGVIDTATATVTTMRSKLGAIENRLDHTINNLTTSSENLTAAESRIRDVDMASEMATYTKLSVMTQAATAMLAQANQQPQQVLSLLK